MTLARFVTASIVKRYYCGSADAAVLVVDPLQSTEQPDVVILGSSLMRRWPSWQTAALSRRVTNLGKDWLTARDLAHAENDGVFRSIHDVPTIVLYIGSNDFLRCGSTEDLKKNLGTILERLPPFANVLFIRIMLSKTLASMLSRETVNEANEHAVDLLRQRPGRFEVVSIDAIVQQMEAQGAPAFTLDGIHLTMDAYSRLAATVKPILSDFATT